jgi:putative ABC transport system substrate-binding protein
MKTLQEGAGTLGLQLHVLNATAKGDFDLVFEKLHELRVEALVIAQDGFFNNQIGQIAALSVQHAVPAIYPNREFAAAGGLMSYGTRQRDVYRQVGVYAGRILNGERPADLPVMRPTKFELVVNLKAAKKLALTLPETLQVAADEVIE